MKANIPYLFLAAIGLCLFLLAIVAIFRKIPGPDGLFIAFGASVGFLWFLWALQKSRGTQEERESKKEEAPLAKD